VNGPPRDRPPTPGPVRPFHFPPFTRHRLDNGLTVLAGASPRAPLVDLALVFPAGAEHDPPGAAGLAGLTAGLLDEGTADRDAPAIAAAVADLGGRVASGADWDTGFAEGQFLARHTGEGLDLLAEIATRPAFPAEELERQRRRRRAELLRRRTDPGYLAEKLFARTVYGDTPYGHTLLGDEESLAGMDRDRVAGFYQRHYPLAAGYLLAAGELDPEAVIARAEAVLGGLPSAAAPTAGPPAAAPGGSLRVAILDRPQGAQTELRLGHPGVPRAHPEFIALTVMNAILGGKFTSRINLNLRERHGFTYGAFSRFDGRRGPGPFAVRTAVETAAAGAAAREVIGELTRIRESPVEAEELDDARAWLIGTFPLSLQTTTGLADRLETLAVYGLPDDYYDRFPDAVLAVGRDDVLAVARRFLRPDELAVVAVGPAAELEPQLAGLGPLEVHPAPDAP